MRKIEKKRKKNFSINNHTSQLCTVSPKIEELLLSTVKQVFMYPGVHVTDWRK